MKKLNFQRLPILLVFGFLVGCHPILPQTVAEAESIRGVAMASVGVRWDWLGGRLWRTADGGKSWQDATPPGFNQFSAGRPGNSRGDEYFFDSQFALFSNFGYSLDKTKDTTGLWRTTDGGKTWSFSKRDDVLGDFHFPDARHGWARTEDDGLGSAYVRYFQTEDGGVNWAPVKIIPPGGEVGEGSLAGTMHLSNIAGDKITFFPPAKAIITTDNNLDFERPKGAVHLQLTTDLGKTWRNLTLPLPAGPYHNSFFHTFPPTFFDANHGVLPVSVFEYGKDGTGRIVGINDLAMIFYASDDGGETWTDVAELPHHPRNPNSNSRFGAVFAFSPKNILVREGAIYHVTQDAGKSWQDIHPRFDPPPATSDPDHWRIEFWDRNHGTTTIFDDLGNHALYQTSDGGETWMGINLPKVN